MDFSGHRRARRTPAKSVPTQVRNCSSCVAPLFCALSQSLWFARCASPGPAEWGKRKQTNNASQDYVDKCCTCPNQRSRRDGSKRGQGIRKSPANEDVMRHVLNTIMSMRSTRIRSAIMTVEPSGGRLRWCGARQPPEAQLRKAEETRTILLSTFGDSVELPPRTGQPAVRPVQVVI